MLPSSRTCKDHQRFVAINRSPPTLNSDRYRRGLTPESYRAILQRLTERERITKSEPSKYRIKVDCRGYKRSSVKVEIDQKNAGYLVVTGKEIDKQTIEEGDYSSKEFRRTFKLPKNVDVSLMKKLADSEGCLILEFPQKDVEKTYPVVGKRKNESSQAEATVENEAKKVKFTLDFPEQFDPSYVKVVRKNQDLTIRVEYLVCKPEGISKLSYYRETTLSQDTDFDALKCTLESNKLIIDAPCKSETKTTPKTTSVPKEETFIKVE